LSPPLTLSPSPPPPWRVVVTRTAEQADEFAAMLRQAGFAPLLFPAIALEALPLAPLDAALDEIASFDWLIFTSGNGVDFFFRRVEERGLIPPWPRIAAVGQATADKLTTRNIPIAFMPDEFVGEALVAGLGDLTGQKVLLPRAKIGRPEIAALLRAAGAELVEVALYDTVTAVPSPKAQQTLAQGFEAVSFTSPSSVRNFLQLIAGKTEIENWVDTAVILCIGPVTAEAATANGLPHPITPNEYTLDGMIGALNSYTELRGESAASLREIRREE
jgi:uroporphyrinogen III methyltransferase / synthase